MIDRRASDSNKWRKYPADVLPLWVADMDFPSPEPVVRALRERVDHGVYGYGFEGPEFGEVFVDRVQKRYGWTISPEALVMIPGVIPGLNVACRALTKPGDGLLMQVPVYPPILRSPGNHELTRDEGPLARDRDGRYHLVTAKPGGTAIARMPPVLGSSTIAVPSVACHRATVVRSTASTFACNV